MSGKLQAEIKQSRPFEPAEEALLSVVRTADAIERRMVEALKPSGLTPRQYNVLRILRGAGEEGRTCSEVGDRLITRDPDVTRMLDRMEKRGLIERKRGVADRRVVRTRITEAGLDLLDGTDPLIAGARQALTLGLSRARLEAAIDVLDEIRNGEAASSEE